MAECKYYKQVRQVSYDNGVTWISLDEYQKGDLYENDSPDCGGGITQYKWVNVSGEYTCAGTTKYQKTKKQQSTDGGQTWTDVNPPEYSTGAVIERDSSDCGGSCLPFLEYCCGRGSHSDCDIQLESASGSRVYDTMYICGESDIGYEVYVTNTLPSWLEVRVYRKDVGFETLEENIGATRYFTVELESNHSSAQRRCTEGNLNSYCTTASVVVKQLGGSDYSNQYLTFVARGSGTAVVQKYTSSSTAQYSKDNGSSWISLTSTSTTISVSNGDKVMFKGLLEQSSSREHSPFVRITGTTQYEIEGNIMSLIYGDNFRGQTSFPNDMVYSICEFTYASSDMYNPYLTSIDNLVLPATTLYDDCYISMFYHCTSITSVPSGFLPATTLANECYAGMFWGCTSLTSVPSDLLPATTLPSKGCYAYMFADTKITRAPDLPAPILPPYSSSVSNDYCYGGMFQNCSRLNYIKCLATSGMGDYTTWNWVDGVSSSGTFVKASNATWSRGIDGIPNNWTVQNA